ncbi:uncharacterized protein LOC100904987 [Galendromus occidentalis]|uniref:Uncharacterized protein LOC100904987 n=1 Tax=Galendromus occidentalis TaxID=34638 RepID=A0AAJ6VWZ7_9ACAR|nr:uncharacterized protein LOC100904987 [Galendromus occidentalis]
MKTVPLQKMLEQSTTILMQAGDRLACIRAQLGAAESRMDEELVLEADQSIRGFESVLQKANDQFRDLATELERYSLRDEDIERLFEEVDSLCTIYKAKMLELTLVSDQLRSHYRRMRRSKTI